MDKRRNCSLGVISPPFHNSFNIYIFCIGVKLHMNMGHLVVRFFSQFCKSDMSKYGYLDVFQSLLEFEITRADCTRVVRRQQSTSIGHPSILTIPL